MDNKISNQEISSPYAWQIVQVQFSNGLFIKSATWNLHNRYGAERHSFLMRYNNPFHVVESDADYLLRKQKQLHQLAQFIQQGMDVIFLQEPDFLNLDGSSVKHTIFNELLKLLECHQWIMIKSPIKNHVPLLTLLNTKTINYPPELSTQGVFWDYRQHQFAGSKILVKRHGYPHLINLINMDCRSYPNQYDNLFSFQESCIRKNQACIIGGQMTYEQPNSLFCANLHTTLYRHPDGWLTCRPPQIGRIYHGFLVSPFLGSKVAIQDLGGLDFDEDENGFIIYDVQTRPTVYESLTSMPWQSDWNMYKMTQGHLKTAHQPQLKALVAQSSICFDKLLQQVVHVPNIFALQLVQNYYEFALSHRYHLFKAVYQGKTGDQAKRNILSGLLEELKLISSIEQLTRFEQQFKQGDAYQILVSGQGIFSKLFNRPTDSSKAVEHMFINRMKTLTVR